MRGSSSPVAMAVGPPWLSTSSGARGGRGGRAGEEEPGAPAGGEEGRGRAADPPRRAADPRPPRRDRFGRLTPQAVQVPPAGAIGYEVEHAVWAPLRLEDGLSL